MGRTTEFISFINSDSIPDERSRRFIYSYIDTNTQLMEVRKQYRLKHNLKYGSSTTNNKSLPETHHHKNSNHEK